MPRETERVRRRFFTAGLGTESNTFIGRPVRLEDFAGAFLCRPGEFPAALTEISAPLYVLRERAKAGEIELVEGTYAFAFPAGRVEDRTYELLRDEILGQLSAALPVDAVVLALALGVQWLALRGDVGLPDLAGRLAAAVAFL